MPLTSSEAARIVEQLKATIDYVNSIYVPTPVEQPPMIQTPNELIMAMQGAVAGKVLILDPGFVCNDELILDFPVVLLNGGGKFGGDTRVDKAQPGPRFTNGITLRSEYSGVVGCRLTRDSDTRDVVLIEGAHTMVESNVILGNPIRGNKRGIAANGAGNVRIAHNYIDDFFGPYPGSDTQAICAWDMLPGLEILDNYCGAAGENILIGGSDSRDEAHMPRDLRIIGNDLVKPPNWQTDVDVNGFPKLVKNLLEIKMCIGAEIAGNRMKGNWAGHGQDGYGVVFTVHNQGGRNPWATIKNVRYHDNVCESTGGAFNILGLEYIKEQYKDRDVSIGAVRRSVMMEMVELYNNKFLSMNTTLGSGGRMNIFSQNTKSVWLEGNIFEGVGHTSAVYFVNGVNDDFRVTDNIWSKTKYVIKGDATLAGQPSWDKFTKNSVLRNNTEAM